MSTGFARHELFSPGPFERNFLASLLAGVAKCRFLAGSLNIKSSSRAPASSALTTDLPTLTTRGPSGAQRAKALPRSFQAGLWLHLNMKDLADRSRQPTAEASAGKPTDRLLGEYCTLSDALALALVSHNRTSLGHEPQVSKTSKTTVSLNQDICTQTAWPWHHASQRNEESFVARTCRRHSRST